MSILTRLRSDKAVVLAAPEHPKPGSDSLIVHVLFVDLVSYSKLPMEKQEEASRSLAECVESCPTYQRALEEGRLTCLDTGDGMALVFEGIPTDPAFAALEIAHCRGPHPERPIRMGLHSGPAMRVLDINHKQNFKGVGVNVAQRVMDCAAGGQITLTEHYAAILGSYEGWGRLIQPWGTKTVKHGVKLRVCELLHKDAPRTTLSAKLHQELPAVPGSLKWLGIFVVIALCWAGLWAFALSTIPPAAPSEYYSPANDPFFRVKSRISEPEHGPRKESF